MHEHIQPKQCKHELKYCNVCDEVYCEKCQEKWNKETHTSDIDKFIKYKQYRKVFPFDPARPYWMDNKMLCSHKGV